MTAPRTPAKTRPAANSVPKITSKPANPVSTASWRERLSRPVVVQVYAIASLVLLLTTTIFWAILGARLQQSNADQLVTAYLFQKADVFHGAIFPGQHSFLIKWPIFWLVQAFGSSAASFIFVTVSLCVITVLGLAIILYKIDRRPLVFGTMCLALASTLLLVPAMPYAGALLPVNMAMLATRNIEYLIFIVCLAILARYHEVKSWGFWLSVIPLSLLVASDKLFLTITLGGAFLALACYVFMRRWPLASLATKWLIAGLISAGLAIGILWAINSGNITHVTNQVAGGYNVVSNVRQLARASVFAGLGVLTNFGANPAFNNIVLRELPGQVKTSFSSIGGVSYIINLALLCFGLYAAFRLLVRSVWKRYRNDEASKAMMVSLMMIWVSLAALGAFIVTDHYYPVDARYLTITLFALFISAASYIRTKQPSNRLLMLTAGVLLISIIFGSIYAEQVYHQQVDGLANLNQRNSLIAQALQHHREDTLAGDYWRVIPARQASGMSQNVTPLASCFEPGGSLTSYAWEPDLHKSSFAYLLTLDRTATGYPGCSLNEVVSNYGRPNASTLIAGSVEKPNELLLFYDHGIRPVPAVTTAASSLTSTVLPIPLNELPYTSCAGPTIMNIVAHEDDDLLFINPDTLHDIKAGHCVRTVYVTAGDAGSGQFYWLSREQGAEAAYARMLGLSDALWIQRIVKLNDHEFLTIANPKDNQKISLIFLNLPDGNTKGQGFGASHNESLHKLFAGQVTNIQSLNQQSDFTKDQLTGALETLMQTYQPGLIRTQATVDGGGISDHSDHMIVGRLATDALQRYQQSQFQGLVQIPIRYYIGYPIHNRPANVSGNDLAEKEAAFFEYARHDGAVCPGLHMCPASQTIDAYLERQYILDTHPE